MLKNIFPKTLSQFGSFGKNFSVIYHLPNFLLDRRKETFVIGDIPTFTVTRALGTCSLRRARAIPCSPAPGAGQGSGPAQGRQR